ncbi:hypothetical protein AQS8620_01359 [Aquimixticola soesokkakensis]|uniref:TadE-like protein n=1 Tax=Aquimixticola soesokkakensis TaxID=1519096 RepID=A0A1Y5SBZ6_9RHOB|nr:hypothetical protein [Aquimixticola soesokkakensis]SLN37292.1 hypothetical protein AQS8620_01359 [Aquimixticola soesokkakensis]
MIRFSKRLATRIRTFGKDTDGSYTVEAMFMLPLLIFFMMALYVYFAGYRAKLTSEKAAYVVADLLSRQTDEVDAKFVDGMGDVFAYLTRSDNSGLTASSVRWSESVNNGAYVIEWSQSTGTRGALTSAQLSDYEDRLPTMVDGETVVIIQTSETWSPPFDAGVAQTEFDNFVVTSPRFAAQVAWAN